MVNLERIFAQSCVQFVQDCQSRKSALQTAAMLVGDSQTEIDPKKLLEKLAEREELGSTVIDETHIAIPHCRIEGCKEPAGAILRFKPDVQFGNAGYVTLAFVLIVPEEDDNTHLKILQSIARLCIEEKTRERLLEASNSSDLRDLVLHYSQLNGTS